MLAQLEHAHPHRRGHIARMLSSQRESIDLEFRERLKSLLTDPDPGVRQAVVWLA